MSDHPVTYHPGDDPEMLEANEKARESFRYFWNQTSLDFNRIVPALELACVKAPFSDTPSDPQSRVEQMWVNEIEFDGTHVSGRLLNSPHHLTRVSAGDSVRFPVSHVSDWICVLEGEVYGAYTVQVIRGRMDDDERQSHDDAWGLDFPPPEMTMVPDRNDEFEQVIAQLILDQLEKEPTAANEVFEEGRTVLHLEALYGRTPCVEVLLQHGADLSARCDRGWTARDYAAALEWEEVLEVLDRYSK